jgi:putative hydrolase of the HAD superfamily
LALSNLNSSSGGSVFVGDSLQADIIPAKKLGMRTIFKSELAYNDHVDAVCNKLMLIPGIVDCFNVR